MFSWDYWLVVPYLFNKMEMCDTFTEGLTRHSVRNPTIFLTRNGRKFDFYRTKISRKWTKFSWKLKFCRKFRRKYIKIRENLRQNWMNVVRSFARISLQREEKTHYSLNISYWIVMQYCSMNEFGWASLFNQGEGDTPLCF